MIPEKHNKKFIIIIMLVWLVIPVVDSTGRLFLGREFYAFRAWEIVKVWNRPGPFKPDFKYAARIYGDLANRLKVRRYRRYRHQVFQTDKYGFRNPDFREDTYFPVVVVGDSDMAGSSLSDNDTYSARLAAALNTPVYNYAPNTVLALLTDERFSLNPPKIIIWEAVERTIFGTAYKAYTDLTKEVPLRAREGVANSGPELPDPKLSEYISKQLFHEARYYLTGIHTPSIGHINRNTGMLFYAPGIEMLKYGNRQRSLDTVIKGIRRIDQICKDRGIALIYLPLPDKENIYSHLLPVDALKKKHRDQFLEDLHKTLDYLGILNVHVLRHFRKSAHDTETLYFLDDTHWNPTGVKTAVMATSRLIAEKKLLR
jgi:hypothetical protein